jgi:ABC-type molybdate transport system substrate-binding protein
LSRDVSLIKVCAATALLAVALGVVGVAGGSGAVASVPTFSGASNTEPAFDFMTQDFVSSANGGNSVTFTFGGSGSLAKVMDSGSDFASNGTGNSPAGDALFASADEANVDNTVPEGAAAAVNTGAVAKYTSGQCIDTNSKAPIAYSSTNGGNNNGTSCPGIGSTRAQYTNGRLVIFACKKGGKTLAPAQGAPTCAAPVSGLFTVSGTTEAPYEMSQVWTDLLAHSSKADGGTGMHTVGGYLAIADPKNGWTFTPTRCGPADVAPNAPYGLAGMESLYTAAVGYYHSNPHPALGKTAGDQACAEIDRLTDRGADLDNYNTTAVNSGGQKGNGNYSDPSLPIIFGDNVTYTQDTVVAGTSQIALLPKSFVVSPGGNDTDFWAEIPECGATNIAHATVHNGWKIAITSTQSCTDSNYVSGMHDNVASKITSGNFGIHGANDPKTLVGENGFYQPIRQWVVVENDDAGQSTATDLTSPDGMSAQNFINYLLSAKGQAILASFGYDPIS